MPVTTDYLIVGAVAALVTLSRPRRSSPRSPAVSAGSCTRRPARAHGADPRRRRHRDVRRLRRRARRRRLMDRFDALFAAQLRAARRAARGDGDVRSSACSTTSARSRRRPRSPARSSPALILVWFGVTMFYFRVPLLDVFFLADDWVPLVTVIWLLGDDPGDQPHRRPRRAGRRHRRHRRRRVLPLQPRARASSAASTPPNIGPLICDHHGRRVPRLPAAQLQPGEDLHGRRRRAAARPADGRRHERRRRPRRPGEQQFSASRTSSSPRCSSRS